MVIQTFQASKPLKTIHPTGDLVSYFNIYSPGLQSFKPPPSHLPEPLYFFLQLYMLSNNQLSIFALTIYNTSHFGIHVRPLGIGFSHLWPMVQSIYPVMNENHMSSASYCFRTNKCHSSTSVMSPSSSNKVPTMKKLTSSPRVHRHFKFGNAFWLYSLLYYSGLRGQLHSHTLSFHLHCPSVQFAGVPM